MLYYEIAVRGPRGTQSIFTYESEEVIDKGTLVSIRLRRKLLSGVVWAQVSKPAYKTLPIEEAIDYRLPLQLLELASWLESFYAAPLSSALQLMLPVSLPKKANPRKVRTTNTARHDISMLPLTTDQSKAITELKKLKKGSAILHGETGSGKTRIYAELVKLCLDQGRSAILLVPEIGMTEQFVADISMITTVQPIVVHSGLTVAERRRAWMAVQNQEPHIIIGTRSALFAPASNIGLIVVDESHDSAYKHEGSPRFHATRVASKLGELHGALVVLGSATPSVADYQLAVSKKAPIIRLANQASGKIRNIKVEIVDKRLKTEFTKSRLLSNTALRHIGNTLTNKGQALLFLNRRGTARICMCQDCGWSAECNTCQLPLAYHRNKQALLCHSCGNTYPLLTTCPNCKSVELSYRSPGVQALADEVSKLFPSARIARIDSDVAEEDNLSNRYQELFEGSIDIIIGTQSLAKGLDLPKLELEVLVDADAGLHMPDYLASERMFQLLYQVMGRIGRHGPGTLIVQTLTPEHPILNSSLERNYADFFCSELKSREAFKYPPFSHVARIIVEHKQETTAAAIAARLAAKVRRKGLVIKGPSPCFYERLRGLYRYQLVVLSPVRSRLTELEPQLPLQATLDIDPVSLL